MEVVRQEREAYHATDAPGDNARLIIEALRREADVEAARAETKIRTAIEKESVRHTKKWTASVSAGTNINLGALLRDDDLVDLLAIKSEQTVALIKSLTRDAVERIERQVLGSIFEGRGNEEIAKALQASEGFSRNRARLIARDQASKLNGAMNMFRQEQAGVTKFQWKTVMDGRERASHHARNGKIYAWSKPPSGEIPGGPINCRCRALAVLIEEPEDAEQFAKQGDPADPFDAVNDPLVAQVAGTMGDDVLAWGRDAVLIRQAETRQVKELVGSARAAAEFTEADTEDLFQSIFGFPSEGQDLARMAGQRYASGKTRTMLFAAISARLDTIEELLEHAADTAAR